MRLVTFLAEDLEVAVTEGDLLDVLPGGEATVHLHPININHELNSSAPLQLALLPGELEGAKVVGLDQVLGEDLPQIDARWFDHS